MCRNHCAIASPPQMECRYVVHLLHLARYLFPHLGNRVKAATNCDHWQWFNDLQSRFQAPFRMSAQSCRHIFVSERMGELAVAGPTPEAAAVVMGNSVERKFAVAPDELPISHSTSAIGPSLPWL